ncbi:hypothetical protein EDEG_00523 [Edhazardia aedis USNM 41457]|uniref:Uncharacterized protein n=1 Tax=Edhazardia aedis (strain USNM 41457) TaxID=1003232 RepID=J8ZNL4_EDHAE|nr:hypothetical protein EDEG_00523 [Edhazardia aedis USNM 41457]|eukprot:EJW01278.1 hypothetical protein EDEG_00523 [Edhazardia aedis USNM 41457]
MHNGVSLTRTAAQENRIFILKFVHLFDLFWKKLFVVADKSLNKSIKRNKDLRNFYNLNKNTSTSFKVEKLRLRPFRYETIELGIHNANIVMFFGAFADENHEKLIEYSASLSDYYRNNINDMNNNIKHKFTEQIEGSEKKLTAIGKSVIEDISIGIRLIISGITVANTNFGIESKSKKLIKNNRDVNEIQNSNEGKHMSDGQENNSAESKHEPINDIFFICIQDWCGLKSCNKNGCQNCKNSTNVYVGYGENIYLGMFMW